MDTRTHAHTHTRTYAYTRIHAHTYSSAGREAPNALSFYRSGIYFSGCEIMSALLHTPHSIIHTSHSTLRISHYALTLCAHTSCCTQGMKRGLCIMGICEVWGRVALAVLAKAIISGGQRPRRSQHWTSILCPCPQIQA
jgi:hypothetical protein